MQPYARVAALHILVNLVSDEPFQPLQHKHSQLSPPPTTRIMRARREYAQRLQAFAQSSDSNDTMVHTTVCAVMFEYLNTGLQSACALMDSCLSAAGNHALISLHKQQREQLYQAYIAMIVTHSSQHATPPSYLRVAVGHALSEFPANHLFLSALIASEQRSQITGRLRRLFDELCVPVASPLVFIFAIRAEVMRIGSEYRIRALCERAVRSNAGASCVALWRMYFLFEVSVNNLDRAERVFFRAIQQCPQSKRLWLDSLFALRDKLQTGQLRELVRVIAEKELRVICDIADVVEHE